MFKYLLCLFFIAILTTCSKRICGCDPLPPAVYFKAVVLETNDSYCAKPLLVFEDSVAFCAHTGLSRSTCVANQLPDSLNIAGKKVRAIVGLLQPNEDFACAGTGTSYPHAKIYHATSSN
jgi:hypothetical protein